MYMWTCSLKQTTKLSIEKMLKIYFHLFLPVSSYCKDVTDVLPFNIHL